MSFYIDLSAFLDLPMKTGIQRISGEICRYSPPGTMIPVRLQANRYVALPAKLIDVIGGYFRDNNPAGVAAIQNLGAFENGSPIKVSANDRVLVAEVFGEPRGTFFHEMSPQEFESYRFIIYDLLPLTHPEFFPPDMDQIISGYYQAIRRGVNCGFISEHTRDVYYGRLKRTTDRGGVVLPLGSDALGSRTDKPTLNRPLTFSVLGTVEPRKNHQLIVEAFEPLLRQIDGLTLQFIGKVGWVDPEFAWKLRALADDETSGFRFHSTPDDGAIRKIIEESRATIYVSAAEGYGLPPVESLWAGTPVIVSNTIPSLERLGPQGIHVVDPVNVINLRRAILAFVDDNYANQKTEETTRLNLPTWRSFTEEVVEWCAQ